MGMDCKYCGAYISSDVDKCPACGKRVAKENAKEYSYGYGAAAAQACAEQPEEKAYTYKEEYARRYGEQEYEVYERTEKSTADNFKEKSEEYKEKAREYTEKAKEYAEKVCSAVENNTGEHKLAAYLSYFGFLFIVPYILHKDDKFCRFHANQGLLLFLANAIISAVGGTLSGIVGVVGWIFVLICFIRGLRSVHRGTMEPLPLIGHIKIL